VRIVRSSLENIAGLDAFGIISFLIFFVFFLGVVVWVIKMKASKIDEYSRLPLQDDEEPSSGNDNLNSGYENYKNIKP